MKETFKRIEVTTPCCVFLEVFCAPSGFFVLLGGKIEMAMKRDRCCLFATHVRVLERRGDPGPLEREREREGGENGSVGKNKKQTSFVWGDQTGNSCA